MVTLRELAKKADVSASTISKVLNEKTTRVPISEGTQERIRTLAKKFGYQPSILARALKTKKTEIVGVLVLDMSDPYYNTVLYEIDRTLDQYKHRLLLSSAYQSPRREELYIEMLQSKYIDGILIIGGPHPSGNRALRELKRTRVPVVSIGERWTGPKIGCVTINFASGGFKATEHLIKLGHRSIAHIAEEAPLLNVKTREDGYMSAMNKYDLSEQCSVQRSNRTAEGGYRAMKKVLEHPEVPSAVFCYNDIVALGVLRAIKEHDLRVPEDIAVIGFDDLPTSAYYEPPLTTMHVFQSESGKSGVELLMRMMKKEITNDEDIQIEPEIVIRKSCGFEE